MLREAGFAEVTGFGIQAYYGPGDPPGPPLLAGIVRALAPVIVARGIATEEEIDIATFEDRLRRDLDAANAVLLPPTVVGAWGRLRS